MNNIETIARRFIGFAVACGGAMLVLNKDYLVGGWFILCGVILFFLKGEEK